MTGQGVLPADGKWLPLSRTRGLRHIRIGSSEKNTPLRSCRQRASNLTSVGVGRLGPRRARPSPNTRGKQFQSVLRQPWRPPRRAESDWRLGPRYEVCEAVGSISINQYCFVFFQRFAKRRVMCTMRPRIPFPHRMLRRARELVILPRRRRPPLYCRPPRRYCLATCSFQSFVLIAATSARSLLRGSHASSFASRATPAMLSTSRHRLRHASGRALGGSRPGRRRHSLDALRSTVAAGSDDQPSPSPRSSSAARIAAGDAGFLTLIQSADRPE
jgi:hypothetical protein